MSDYIIVNREDLELAEWLLNNGEILKAHRQMQEILDTPPAEGREQKPVAYVSQELIDGECVGSMAYAVQPTPEHVPVYTAPADTGGQEYNGWYCAHCQRGVDGSEVTFHEQHTECGRVITDDLPPAPADTEQPSEAVQEQPSSLSQFVNMTDAEREAIGQRVAERATERQRESMGEQPITAQEATAALDIVLGYRTHLATAIEYGKHGVVEAAKRLRNYIEQTAQDREDAERWRHLQLMSKDHVIEIIQGTSIPYRYGGCSFTEEVDKDRKDRQQGKEGE